LDRAATTTKAAGVASTCFQRERARLDDELSGLDARQVEDVVDHVQQVIAGVHDPPNWTCDGKATLSRKPRRAKPQHGVQRGANLVAHVGEKVGLHLRQPLCFVARGLEFDSTHSDPFLQPGVQRRQRLALLGEQG
jgi:hypothetical protein